MAAPWEALLNPQPTQIQAMDTSQNPDYDQLMGINTNTGDNVQDFTNGLQSIMQRNTPQGKAMTMEIAKSKLANQMAVQLMQTKIDLEKANPTYVSHTQTWGGVLMVDPRNPDNNYEVGGDESGVAKQTYLADKQAELAEAQRKMSPAYIQQQDALTQAQIEKEKAQTAAANANASFIEGAKTNRYNQPTAGQRWDDPAESKKIIEATYEKYQIPKNPDMFWRRQNPGVLEKAQQEAQQEIDRQRQLHGQGTGAPTGDSTPPPDIGSLLNLSNAFGPQQGLFGQ